MFYYYHLIKRQLWPVGLFCSPWPEQALRANIHCQISLALNRIYTEWYPSKGYSFNITNSTSYANTTSMAGRCSTSWCG